MTQGGISVCVAQDMVECGGQRRSCSLISGESLPLLVYSFCQKWERDATNVRPIALLKNASASRVKPCFSLPIMAEMKSSLPSCLSIQLKRTSEH
jgi:hypothetical protein